MTIVIVVDNLFMYKYVLLMILTQKNDILCTKYNKTSQMLHCPSLNDTIDMWAFYFGHTSRSEVNISKMKK